MALTLQEGEVTDQWFVEDERGLAEVRREVLGHLERRLAAAHAHGGWDFSVGRGPSLYLRSEPGTSGAL
jgi:hypothetical protein